MLLEVSRIARASSTLRTLTDNFGRNDKAWWRQSALKSDNALRCGASVLTSNVYTVLSPCTHHSKLCSHLYVLQCYAAAGWVTVWASGLYIILPKQYPSLLLGTDRTWRNSWKMANSQTECVCECAHIHIPVKKPSLTFNCSFFYFWLFFM